MAKGDRYKCLICAWIYDPAVGEPNQGIPPGVPFEDLPDDFECPPCGAKKFKKVVWVKCAPGE